MTIKSCILCGQKACNTVAQRFHVCDVHRFEYEIEAEQGLPMSKRPMLGQLIMAYGTKRKNRDEQLKDTAVVWAVDEDSETEGVYPDPANRSDNGAGRQGNSQVDEEES